MKALMKLVALVGLLITVTACGAHRPQYVGGMINQPAYTAFSPQYTPQYVPTPRYYSTAPSSGPVQVRGYYRKDGTYVAPHYRTRPDGYKYNNYSSDRSYRRR